MINFIKERFLRHFENLDEKDFEKYYGEYKNIKPFKVNENIYESNQTISQEAHYILRMAGTYQMIETLKALKIDLNDPNVKEELEIGNIGTAGRIVKLLTGADKEDDRELMSGRWNKIPRMATFPNSTNQHDPIFITTRLDAVCSHHFIRFGQNRADTNSLVVVGYIPRKVLGGISKINRFVNWCARRGWLQEELTNYIGKKIEESFETDSVYVGLFNMQHGCSAFRGACDLESSTTTTYLSGEFEKNPQLIPDKYR